MADSPPSSAAAKPRRQRRWLRRVCWGFLLALVLLWLVRVPLANWALHRLPGDWDISITGLRPGFSGARLEGVRVVHRPTGRLFVLAQEAVATNGWGGLLKGALGSLTLNKAEVTWREEFETPYVLPVEGNPPAQPLVTWNMGKVTDSVFTWYEAGRELPRLSLKIVSLDGGRFIVYEDGRVEAAEQNLVLADVVSREDAMAGEMEIETRRQSRNSLVRMQGH